MPVPTPEAEDREAGAKNTQSTDLDYLARLPRE